MEAFIIAKTYFICLASASHTRQPVADRTRVRVWASALSCGISGLMEVQSAWSAAVLHAS